ncbi:Hypothetical predicted protein [Mytilus galloprovincialis]|nr:Hypothetical predicted protein [Mytilus galloprovincialis]
MRLIADGKCYKDLIHIFNVCVQNAYSLCCRYIFKCNQWIYSIPSLIKVFKKSIGLATKTSVYIEEAKHVDTAKAIAWHISRMFYLSQQTSGKIKNIYPAFKCVCKNKSSVEFFCSDSLHIVVVVAKNIPSLPKKYKGIPIYQKVTNGMCTEGERIQQKHDKLLREQSRSVCLLHGVSSKYAHQLFSDHSNLFSIVPSLIRSKSFKIKRNRFNVEKCVTITCGLKGFIPIGERHFPDSLNASDGTIVKTDVIEGNVNLANLLVGDHIESTTMSGTLGGMLLYYNRICFITCAHVMLDEQSMISRKNNSIHNKDLRVFVKDANGQRIECGNAMRCDFETGSDTKPGIDVAIIEMNDQCKVNPHSMVLDKANNPHSFMYLGMSNEYLNDNCIDYELLTLTHSEVETMAFGQVTTVENCKTGFEPERIIEVQLKSLGQAVAVANGNPTFPVMIAQPAHFQMSQGSLPATTTFRMYNQLCLNIPLVPGDSGTCIYIKDCPYSKANEKCKLSDNKGKCPHSGCLGMAIAFSNGMSIVTPMKKIFEHI